MSRPDTDDDETFELGYQAGCEAARAGMTSDLKAIVDFITREFRLLRIEICKATGQPPPPPLGMNGFGKPQ